MSGRIHGHKEKLSIYNGHIYTPAMFIKMSVRSCFIDSKTRLQEESNIRKMYMNVCIFPPFVYVCIPVGNPVVKR